MFRQSHLGDSARSSSLDFELGVNIGNNINRNMSNSQDFSHYHRHEQPQLQECHRGRSVPVMDEGQPTLQWFLLPQTGPISFQLITQQPIVIGSGDNCDIQLHTPSVEKRHAVLAFQPNSNRFTVRDLSTTNGTYLNKRRISADHPETVSNLDLLRFGYDSGSVSRSGISRVSSPSLTLDSGRGSSSAPSSPAKEMSPVQMTTTGGATAPGGVTSGPSSGGLGATMGTSSNSSHNASPVFARKLSRPMEYLLGQHSTEDGQPDCSAFTPDPPTSGCSSGNFASFCSDPLQSFVTNGSSSGCASGLSFNHKLQRASSIDNNNINRNLTNHGYCSGGGGDCEILQITEDYENTNMLAGAKAPVVRKDSLEEDLVDQDHSKVIKPNSDIISTRQVQPQFRLGGDIMQPDLDVPNEVFGPLSHAEILSRNISSGNSNLNSQHSSTGSGRQGNKPETPPVTSPSHARARSSSGDGGSNRSTPLSALYGTPHWWPDSSPDENVCPPPPASSTNCSPFKKPFLLNNNQPSCNIANSQSIINAASCRLKGNSSSSSLTDHVKDLSLESTHSQTSNRTASSPLPAATGDTMEKKKFTPMAFTIDFSDSEGGASGGPTNEAVEAKKAAIAERLSKFAPRHKRNTKNEECSAKDGEPTSLSSSKSNSKSNSLGRSQHQQQKQSSVLTTGSGDSSAVKSASLPKKLSSKHPSGGSNSTNNNDSGLRSLSPETISSTTSSSSRSRPAETPRIGSGSVTKLSSPSSSTPRDSSMTRKSKSQGQSGRGATPASKRTTGGGNTEEKINGSGISGRINNNISKLTNKLNDLSKESSSSSPKTSSTKKAVPSSPVVAVVADKEDTVSEAGTYTVEKETPEVEHARGNIEEIFGLNGTDAHTEELDKENEEQPQTFIAEPGTRDWVREWAELAAKQHQQKSRPELPDSQFFLRETETLVSAIQERVSKHMKNGEVEQLSLDYGVTGSESDDDEPTLSHHTPVKSQSQLSTPTNTGKKRPPSRTSPFHRESSVLSDSGYAIGYQSDSSNEGSRRGDLISHGLGNKMNMAFNIRRGRVGYDAELGSEHHLMMNQQSITGNNISRGISPKPNQVNGNKFSNVGGLRSGSAGTSTSHFARNDGGRFSLRMAKSRTPPAQMPPHAPARPTQNLYSGGEANSRGMNGHKSDNHLGQAYGVNSKKVGVGSGGKILNNAGSQQSKKSAGNRSNSTLTAKEVELANWKRRKNYDPMKAAAEGKKGPRKNGVGGENGVEDLAALPPIAGSPKVNRREAMMTKSLSFHQESYSPKCGSEDEDMIYIVDEMDSSHSNSPNHLGMTRSYHEDAMYYGMPSSSSIRQKNKLEALDNLVIATIHSLSNKVRTSSKQLLEKLQLQHTNDENGALLEEMVNQLKELEGPTINSSPNKSPSRELSGTLKNLKKLEQVILVLDKVLCEDFETDMNT